MNHIQSAIAEYLEQQTLLHTVKDRSACRVYPSLAVKIRQTGSLLLDGGRQSENSYTVEVTAISDRERTGTTALLSSLMAPLLRGIPMGERTLRPMHLETEDDTLSFDLVLCVAVPPESFDPAGSSEKMEHIHLPL